MKIELHPNFKKVFKKRIFQNPKLVKRVEERTELFQIDADNATLKDHPLVGSRKGYRAFSVTGDVRIVYYRKSSSHVVFVDIGAHNQVY